MESVLRALIIYLVILFIFRISGKRTLSNSTPFDLVLVLIISETTQEALVDGDYSLTNCIVLITTLIVIDFSLSFLKQRSRKMEKVIEGTPMLIVENGKPLKDRMDRARISEDDVLSSARQLRGLEKMEQIRYAILETNGTITVIPSGN
jgi:uncharacterized membrane protein YcaP (DUF421 family)